MNVSNILNDNDIVFSSKSFEDVLIDEKNVFIIFNAETYYIRHNYN